MTALNKEQRKAWDILKDPYLNETLKDNPSLVRELRRIQKTGQYTNRMAVYITSLAARQFNLKRWVGYSYKEDMIGYAIMMLMMHLLKFDISRSNNIKAYMKQLCDSAFIQFISREKRQHHIKQDLLEQIHLGTWNG